MRKETVSFSETTDNDFENGLLDALAQERSAILEIEQEKEENSLATETASVPTSKEKTVEGHAERSTNPAGRFRPHNRRFPQRAVMVGQAGYKRRQTIPLPRYRAFRYPSGMGCSTGRNCSSRTNSAYVLETDHKGRISGHYL